uniref:Uncharacterized protein n=1 Tax=Chromera velia CCMP2878 TaxID=1169474 RepID=A0A0G4F4X6_9ALVE|eukprot:Cvel_15092.t1-p1 / transcript=Cvel_15092.t1 / gene=Cvel_15092 / organism=Chromera_velia_CCMP2878 / gene_product=hypothetical protein / transcript_product=hypothetical protein / location=Cvel_scaffold1101:15154-16731(+) / protein_length=526 / sequence_SO=supercontig / SO=protein_coding / is_pseudo=false
MPSLPPKAPPLSPNSKTAYEAGLHQLGMQGVVLPFDQMHQHFVLHSRHLRSQPPPLFTYRALQIAIWRGDLELVRWICEEIGVNQLGGERWGADEAEAVDTLAMSPQQEMEYYTERRGFVSLAQHPHHNVKVLRYLMSSSHARPLFRASAEGQTQADVALRDLCDFLRWGNVTGLRVFEELAGDCYGLSEGEVEALWGRVVRAGLSSEQAPLVGWPAGDSGWFSANLVPCLIQAVALAAQTDTWPCEFNEKFFADTPPVGREQRLAVYEVANAYLFELGTSSWNAMRCCAALRFALSAARHGDPQSYVPLGNNKPYPYFGLRSIARDWDEHIVRGRHSDPEEPFFFSWLSFWRRRLDERMSILRTVTERATKLGVLDGMIEGAVGHLGFVIRKTGLWELSDLYDLWRGSCPGSRELDCLVPSLPLEAVLDPSDPRTEWALARQMQSFRKYKKKKEREERVGRVLGVIPGGPALQGLLFGGEDVETHWGTRLEVESFSAQVQAQVSADERAAGEVGREKKSCVGFFW